MQDLDVRTTETSSAEGRLKVSTGMCQHGRKKCLKCAIRNDGKGGGGWDNLPSFKESVKKGATTFKIKNTFRIKKPIKTKIKSSKSFGGIKGRRVKSSVSLKSVLRPLSKKRPKLK